MFEGREGVACEETAFVDDSDAIGEQFHLRESMRGEKKGSVSRAEDLRFKKAAKVHGGDGVQTARGLIEKKHAGLMKQGAGETEALDGAGGESARLAVENVGELELFGKLRDAEIRGGAGKMIQLAEEAQVFAPGEPGVEAVICAGVIAETAPDRAGVALGIVAGDAGGTASGEKKRGENTQ